MPIKNIMKEIDEALFPSNIYCISCGSLIDRSRSYGLCDDCIRKMHWISGGIDSNGKLQRLCAKCGKVLQDEYLGKLCYDCMEQEHYFSRGFSCLTYGMYEREIMMDIKYHDKAYLAKKMGEILFDRMAALINEADARGMRPFDCVIPVPLSEARLRKRGYNQAQVMAKSMLKRWKQHTHAPAPRLEAKVLYRSRETEMLRSLNPAERRLALDGVFTIKSGTEDRIIGRNILLIDDVYTTGATADACSKALLEAGARGVYLLSLASGGNRRKNELEKARA